MIGQKQRLENPKSDILGNFSSKKDIVEYLKVHRQVSLFNFLDKFFHSTIWRHINNSIKIGSSKFFQEKRSSSN